MARFQLQMRKQVRWFVSGYWTNTILLTAWLNGVINLQKYIPGGVHLAGSPSGDLLLHDRSERLDCDLMLIAGFH